jgi:hypothetical protein
MAAAGVPVTGEGCDKRYSVACSRLDEWSNASIQCSFVKPISIN